MPAAAAPPAAAASAVPAFAPAAPGGFGGAARTQSVAPGTFAAPAAPTTPPPASATPGAPTPATPPGAYPSPPGGFAPPRAGFGGSAAASSPSPGAAYSTPGFGGAGFGGSAAGAGARAGSGLDVPVVPPPGAPGVAPAVQSGFSVPTAQAAVGFPQGVPVAAGGKSRKTAIAIAAVAVVAIIIVIAVAASGGGDEAAANATASIDEAAAKPEPRPPQRCSEAADAVRENLGPELAKKHVGKAALARIGMAIERHCKSDAWSAKAIDCFTAATSDADNGTCLKMISDKQQDALIKHIDQIVEDDKASRAPPDIEAGSAVAVADTAESGSATEPADAMAGTTVDAKIPSACADYRAQLAKLKRCRRVPRRVRHGFETEYSLILKSWKETPKTAALREATEKVCTAGTRSVRDLRRTHCRR